jgi:uncharacterized protein YndB with AHSA1/START domain
MNDLMAELERVRRAVGSETGEEGPAHVVELRRIYGAPVADVWDVCTNPERIPRWFLPISGDLRLGGRFQLEGNAGGEITECRPPRRLAVTWEFGGDASLVTVDLAPAEDGTELTLRHVVGDNDHWATYGPGPSGSAGSSRSWASRCTCAPVRRPTRRGTSRAVPRGRPSVRAAAASGEQARPTGTARSA